MTAGSIPALATDLDSCWKLRQASQAHQRPAQIQRKLQKTPARRVIRELINQSNRKLTMFTIKLYRQGGMQETVVSACWYEVFGSDGRFTIVTHQEMPCASGVGFEISNIEDESATGHYQVCFIENQKGKTIASYKAKGFKSL